jgi:hypothetical protein
MRIVRPRAGGGDKFCENYFGKLVMGLTAGISGLLWRLLQRIAFVF